MLLRLILLLTIVPVVELIVLLEVHGAIADQWGTGAGLLATLGSTLLTGVVGASLARRQGLATIRALRDASSRGVSPAEPLVDGAMILVGATLLLTPGLLSDAVGLILLIPWARRPCRRAVLRSLERRFARGEAALRARIDPEGPFGSGPVIDVTPADDPNAPESRPSWS